MAAFTLRRFSRPEVLRAVHPDHLVAFLRPHGGFFRSRGVAVPPAGSAQGLDYPGLVEAFLTPDATTPRDLIDALFLIDEMATPRGMDALLDEAKRRGLRLAVGTDHSPADVAVQVWLRDRDVLERKHAEQLLGRARSFESYQTGGSGVPAYQAPTAKQLGALDADLGRWFLARNRGGGTKVMVYDHEGEVWFLVRHGEPFKRDETLAGAAPSSVCYRPLTYDVLVYTPQVGELRIHAQSKCETRLYREAFGRHLFGDEDAFPDGDRYTLGPLRETGECAVSVADVEGIDWVRLVEVQLLLPGSHWELVTRTSDDLFALFESQGKPFPAGGRMIRAAFRVKFTDSKTPRSVVIKPPNVAQFTRDDDGGLVEAWLLARGLIVRPGTHDVEHRDSVLEGA